MWQWLSMPPGSTSRPLASISCAPGARLLPRVVTTPSLMPISQDAVSTAVAGATTGVLLDNLYVGSWNGTVGRVVAIDPATGLASAWNPGLSANGFVQALAVDGTTVYAGGKFTQAGGQARSNLAALDATTTMSERTAGEALFEMSTTVRNAPFARPRMLAGTSRCRGMKA